MRTRTIRPAVAGDAVQLADIFLAARQKAMPWLRRVHSAEDVRAGFPAVLLDRYETYVAEADGTVVGFASLGDGVLAHLYVAPDHQRRGVGSALVDHAKELRPDGFRLYVFQRNVGARHFYERHGFRLIALGDGSGNEEHEPDAHYEWRPGAP